MNLAKNLRKYFRRRFWVNGNCILYLCLERKLIKMEVFLMKRFKLIPIFTIMCILLISCSLWASASALEIWVIATKGEPEWDYFQERLVEFKKSYPEIEVDLRGMGQKLAEVLRPRIVQGSPPDLFFYNEGIGMTMAREGVLTPLDKWLDADEQWKNSFISTSLDRVKYNDKYYSIPDSFMGTQWYYNKKVFEKVGIDSIPKTWSEFLETCKVLKEAGIEPIAVDGTVAWYNVWYFGNLASQLVGHQKLTDTILNKPGTSWEDPKFLKAAQMVQELYKKGYIMKGAKGSTWPAARLEFLNGYCGMMYEGGWLVASAWKIAPSDFQWVSFPWPQVEGGESNLYIPGKVNGWWIPKDGENKEEAIKWLKFITSKESKEIQSDKFLNTPSIKGIDIPAALESDIRILESAIQVIPQYFGLLLSSGDYRQKVFEPLNDKMMFCEITAEEFIRELQDQHNQYYKNK